MSKSKILVLVVAVACATALIWWAGPGSATDDEAPPRAGFSVAGDGRLPTSAPDLRSPRDPLSADEIGYAIAVATSDPGLAAGATDVYGDPGWEVLSVEVPDEGADDRARQATVTLYDYASDTTYLQLVDLTRGRVTDSRAATALQRPPSVNETQVAASIAVAAEPPPAFLADFEASEGLPLVSAEQIGYVAGLWRHDDLAPGGRECGQERCVRLLVSTGSGRYLDTTDFVVNLSRRAVVRLNEED